MQFPEHFPLEILIASQTATRYGIDNNPSDSEIRNLYRVAWFLETLRTKLISRFSSVKYGNIIVSSGYRCKTLNRKIGGSRTSNHVKGLCVDIVVPGMSAYDLAKFIEENMAGMGWDQLIHEFGRWVHVGLSEDIPRQEVMTAKKIAFENRRKTVYVQGIEKVAA